MHAARACLQSLSRAGTLAGDGHVCICSLTEIHRYWRKVGGALLDRIDLRVPLAPVPAADMCAPPDRGGGQQGGRRRPGSGEPDRGAVRWPRIRLELRASLLRTSTVSAPWTQTGGPRCWRRRRSWDVPRGHFTPSFASRGPSRTSRGRADQALPRGGSSTFAPLRGR